MQPIDRNIFYVKKDFYMTIKKNIGKRIKELRKKSGMTQGELAIGVGVTYQQIQKYEKGTSSISTDKLFKIAEILGINIDMLLKEEEVDENELDSSNISDTPDMDYISKIARYVRKIKDKAIKDMVVEFARVAASK